MFLGPLLKVLFSSHSMVVVVVSTSLTDLFPLHSDASQTLSGATDHISSCLQTSSYRCPTEISKSACPKPSSSSFTFPKPASPPVSPPLSAQCCYPPKYSSWRQQSVILGSSYQHPITNRALLRRAEGGSLCSFSSGI